MPEGPFVGEAIFDLEGSFDDEAGGTFSARLTLQTGPSEAASYRGMMAVTLFRGGQRLDLGEDYVTLLKVGEGSISFTIEDRSGAPRTWSFSGSWIGDEITGHHILRQVTIPGWNEGSWKGKRRGGAR